LAGPELELEFRITGPGWADLHIRKSGRIHEIGGISYLGDALDDLLRLGLAIATDRGYGWAQFRHEPGSTVLFAEDGWWEGERWVFGHRVSVIDFGDGEPAWSRLREAERRFTLGLESRGRAASGDPDCRGADRRNARNGRLCPAMGRQARLSRARGRGARGRPRGETDDEGGSEWMK